MNSTNEGKPGFEQIVVIIVPIIFALIILCGLIGNLLVIIVFTVYRSLQESTNVLIINLACADLMFLVFCVPFTALAYAQPYWPFHDVWCYVNTYLQHVSAYASVWTLVLLAFDRFLAVVLPIRSLQFRTTCKTAFAIVFLWFILLTANLHVFTTTGIYRYEFNGQNRTACVPYLTMVDASAPQSSVKAFFFVFNISAYIIPLSVTCILYLLLLRRLWQGNWHLFSNETIKLKRRVTLLVILITIIFALCWLPLNINFLLRAMQYPDEAEGNTLSWAFQVLAQILAYMNSCLNPILYGIMSENFRLGLSNLLHVMACRQAKNTISKGSFQAGEDLRGEDTPQVDTIGPATIKAAEEHATIMLEVIRSAAKSSTSSRNSKIIVNLEGDQFC